MYDLLELLGPTRTASAASLGRLVTGRTIERWLASGRLVRLHPGGVTTPEFAGDWTVRAHAATGYTGGPLSHMSALAVHRVVDNEVTRLDVTVPPTRRVRISRWRRVHRSRTRFAVVRSRGLPATTVARSLVDTWGDAHRSRAMRGFDDVARGALLQATRRRIVTVTELDDQRASRPPLPGHAALTELLRLEGAAFHGSRDARERDLRRDAALAALGWVVLRFSYLGLTREPAACRAQILAVYQQRCGVVP